MYAFVLWPDCLPSTAEALPVDGDSPTDDQGLIPHGGSEAGDALSQPYIEASLARMTMFGSIRSAGGATNIDSDDDAFVDGDEASLDSEAGEILSVSAYVSV